MLDSICLESLTDYNIDLRGNTDNTGSSAYNQKLSEERCASVKQYLLDKGISADQFRTQGFGETIPIAENSTDNGKQRNRRVELFVTWQKKVFPYAVGQKTVEKPTAGTGIPHVTINPALTSEFQNIESFYNKMLISNEAQTFTFKSSKTETKTIQTEKKTVLVFPPDAFDVPENTPVQITIKEFYRIEDIIAQKLNTQTGDDRLLISGGMVYTEAKTADGKIIQPKKFFSTTSRYSLSMFG